MRIDLSPLFAGKTAKIPFRFDFILPEELFDVTFPDPIRVEGEVTDSAGFRLLRLKAAVPYVTRCARCLDEIRGKIEVPLERSVSDGRDLVEKDSDEYLIAENGSIELEEVLTEQILLEFPPKFLCKEDCKGLCPKCGINLNRETCSCDLSEPDPRFRVLREWLAAREKEEPGENDSNDSDNTHS